MPADGYVHRPPDGKRDARRRGQLVAEIAAHQQGVVARWQLREMGLSEDRINGWIARRRLIAIYRGVFAVGRRPLTNTGRCVAAALAGGRDAALSNQPAAWAWDLRDSIGRSMHVTVPTRRRSRGNLVFHHRRLPRDERTVHEGIPITTAARTIFDSAATETDARLRQMIALAEARTMADAVSLPGLMERYPAARGTAKLRAVLTSAINEGVADRELEIRFAEFVDESGLRRPHKNVPIEASGQTFIVDCFWPEARVAVELDSRKHHADWESAEADRARDAALIAIGIPVVRVTWRRLHNERAELRSQLRSALNRALRLPSHGRPT
jgi:predicted transcriptional regulator of viral defense system